MQPVRIVHAPQAEVLTTSEEYAKDSARDTRLGRAFEPYAVGWLQVNGDGRAAPPVHDDLDLMAPWRDVKFLLLPLPETTHPLTIHKHAIRAEPVDLASPSQYDNLRGHGVHPSMASAQSSPPAAPPTAPSIRPPTKPPIGPPATVPKAVPPTAPATPFAAPTPVQVLSLLVILKPVGSAALIGSLAAYA
jgi:hypothetical protein